MGLEFEFKHKPTTRRASPVFRGSAEQNRDLLEHLEAWLAAGTVEPTSLDKTQIVSLLFPVKKSNGTNRWCLDLRRFNEALVQHKFKLDGLETVRTWIRPNDFLATIDLKNAYQSVLVARRHRRFLAFRVGDRLFRHRCQTFGASSSPFIFTKLMKPIVRKLVEQGIRISFYLDDALIAAESFDQCRRHVARACRLLTQLGFEIATEKSRLVPARQAIYLGLTIDTARFRLAVPQKKLADLRREARKVERAHHEQNLSVRQLARLGGKLNALMPAMRAAAFRRHPIERCVQYGLRAAGASPSAARARTRSQLSYDVPVQLSRTALLSVRWLTHVSRRTTQCDRPLRPPTPKATLTTDASPTGYGATLQIGARRLELARFWSARETTRSQNERELTGLVRAFMRWLPLLVKAKHVRVRTDNTTALSCLRRLGSRHRHLGIVVEPLVRAVLRHRLELQAHHIPGELNSAADRLSRLTPPAGEWYVKQAAYERACKVLDSQPTMDWFATHVNSKCDRFCTFQFDPIATHSNAMAWTWSTETGWFVPPINLIGQVWQKIEEDQAEGILVLPFWPTKAWFAAVKQRATKQFHFQADDIVVPGPRHPFRDKKMPPMTAFLLRR